jgi:sugar phosphate isomerase/epimerase
MRRVHIGQMLNAEDLTGTEWQKRYAEPGQLGSMLKECGITFVDLGITAQTDEPLILGLAEVFADAGLFISLDFQYGSFSSEPFNSHCTQLLTERLRIAQSVANITKVPVPYVFHCDLSNSMVNKKSQELLSGAKNIFTWIDKMIVEQYGDVVVLCESWNLSIEPEKQNEYWQNCLTLIEETNLGICWDFGHSWLVSNRIDNQRFPGESFLARVDHVHAYDTHINGSDQPDHLPLEDGTVPWREYCSLLARHDYDSTIVLKVDPLYYHGLYNFLQGVRDGVRKLRVFFD